MSAQKSGRQSPPPEGQSGPQLHDVPGTGKSIPNAAPSDEHAKQSSDQALAGLQSNPVHPLEQAAREKL
ncbi:hypothetical protein BGW36DRAFT_389371, partial [Talaromyces proteolyticus]